MHSRRAFWHLILWRTQTFCWMTPASHVFVCLLTISKSDTLCKLYRKPLLANILGLTHLNMKLYLFVTRCFRLHNLSQWVILAPQCIRVEKKPSQTSSDLRKSNYPTIPYRQQRLKRSINIILCCLCYPVTQFVILWHILEPVEVPHPQVDIYTFFLIRTFWLLPRINCQSSLIV